VKPTVTPPAGASRTVLTRRTLLASGAAAAVPALAAASSARAATGPEVVTNPASSADNVVAGSAAVIDLTIRAAPDQVANLTEWRRESGDPGLVVNNRGDVRMPVPAAGKGPFGWRVAGSTFRGLWDPSTSIGYNIGNNSSPSMGVPTVAGEPFGGFLIESDYDDGQKRTVEAYLEARAQNGVLNCRPFMYQVSRFATTPQTFDTGSVFIGNPLTISAVRNGAGTPQNPVVDCARFAANHVQALAPLGDRPNLLSVNAPAGSTSQLRLGANDVAFQWIVEATASRLDLLFGYAGTARFYGNPKGAPGAAFAVGADDNQAAGVFDTAPSANGLKGLVVRGKSTMTENLVEVQDAARAVRSGYDREGTWFTNRTTPPADADIKTGQMSIWFDHVGGNMRFTTRAANGKVRTGSIPLAVAAAV
jgi:hypothetical protein